MSDFGTVVTSAPASNLLIMVGAAFLFLAVVGQIAGKIQTSKGGRIVAGALGVTLVATGILLNATRTGSSDPAGGRSGPESVGSERESRRGTEGDDRAGTETSVLVDLLAEAPRATWTSGAGPLPWEGSDADPRGFARWRDTPSLEDGSIPIRVLQAHPQWIAGGEILGEFKMPRVLRDGDRFKSKVGFLTGGRGAVEFVVEARGGTLPNTQTLATITDSGQDNKLKSIDADLTLVAGAGALVLKVKAGPSSGQDWSVWVDPRVEQRR